MQSWDYSGDYGDLNRQTQLMVSWNPGLMILTKELRDG